MIAAFFMNTIKEQRQHQLLASENHTWFSHLKYHNKMTLNTEVVFLHHQEKNKNKFSSKRLTKTTKQQQLFLHGFAILHPTPLHVLIIFVNRSRENKFSCLIAKIYNNRKQISLFCIFTGSSLCKLSPVIYC